MRNILLGLTMMCVVMLACRKENSKPKISITQNKAQKVTFTVGFSKSVTKFQVKAAKNGSLNTNSLATSSTPDTALTNYITELYYMVFDSAGNYVHTITQSSADTAFGHYTDYLPQGKYTVGVAGGETGFSVQPGPLSSAYLFYGVYMGTGTDLWPGNFDKDAFFSKVDITVSSTPSTQAFTLSRIVSKLIVNINDTIPAGAENSILTIGYPANIYFVGSETTGVFSQGMDQVVTTDNTSLEYNFVIPIANRGQPNYQMSTLFLYDPSYPMTVDILVYTTGALIYGEKVVDNITGQPNKITLLSGNLFGTPVGNSTGGFQISVDTTWNTPVIKTFP